MDCAPDTAGACVCAEEKTRRQEGYLFWNNGKCTPAMERAYPLLRGL